MMRDYASWYEKTVQAGEEMSAASVEYVGGIEVIKAFGQSASSYEKFSNAVTRYARSFIDWMHHCQIFQDGGLAIWAGDARHRTAGGVLLRHGRHA